MYKNEYSIPAVTFMPQIKKKIDSNHKEISDNPTWRAILETSLLLFISAKNI